MSKPGYVIAKNKAVNAFFTSASAFDRPSWVGVNEAKVYPTPELAEKAAKKLYGYGAYEARIVTVSEAMAFELPDENVSDDPHAADLSPEEGEKVEMVAIVQGGDEEPIHQGDETKGVEGAVDANLGIDDEADRAAIDAALDAEEDLEGEQVAGGPDGAPIVGESETMPAKPPLDAQPSENKNTAMDLPKTPVIKYHEKATDNDEEATELDKSGAWSHDAKVKTPANVIKDLKDAIAAHQHSAEVSNKKNDAKASFCLTVAGAFEELLDDLEQGTAEGIKSAQIHMTSWMNPITVLLPQSVQQFVLLSGRKPSLKDFFNKQKTVKESVDTERNHKLAQYKRDRQELLARKREAAEEGDTAEVKKIEKSLAVVDGAIKNLSK